MSFVSELTYPNKKFDNDNVIKNIVTNVEKQSRWSSIYGYYCILFHSSHSQYIVPAFKKTVEAGYIYKFNLLNSDRENHFCGIYCVSTGEELFNFKNKVDIQNAMAHEIKEDNIKLIDELNESFEELTPFSKACIESYRDYYYSKNHNEIFDYLLYKRYINLFTALEKRVLEKKKIKSYFDYLEMERFDTYTRCFNKPNEYYKFATLLYNQDKNIEFKSEIFDKYNIDLKK